MKKKTMAFGGLLMAVAMTGYSVAGTYAKYTSSLDFTDEARVAKWELKALKGGCKLVEGVYYCDPLTNGQQIDLFANSYSLATAADGKKEYVRSINGDKVVAPGTSGTYGIRFEGAMEVRHDFNIDFDVKDGEEVAVWYKVETKDGKEVLSIENTQLDNTYKKYSPIKYTLRLYHTDKTEAFNYVDKSLDEIKDLLDAWKNSADNNFAPGRLDLALDISWKWDTITGYNADGTTKVDNTLDLTAAQVNELDTYIGKNWSQTMHKNNAADKPANNFGTKSTYTIGVSATQIAEDYSTKTVQP